MSLLKSSEEKVLHCPICLKVLEHSEVHGEDCTLNDDSGVCDAPITSITCDGCEFTLSVNFEFYGIH